MAAHASSLPLPARHPGPWAGPLSPGPRRPALRPTLKKFTSCGWLSAARVGSSPYPPPQVSHSHLASGRNVVPLGFPSRENWGLGWRSDILGSRPSAAGRSGDWLRDREVSLGPASQVCPPVVSLHTCIRNPSKSGLDVCSPRLMESHPSGTVLERVIGHFLGSEVLARQTPGASRATKAGFGKDRMGRGKSLCAGTVAWNGRDPRRELGLLREDPPSTPA